MKRSVKLIFNSKHNIFTRYEKCCNRYIFEIIDILKRLAIFFIVTMIERLFLNDLKNKTIMISVC